MDGSGRETDGDQTKIDVSRHAAMRHALFQTSSFQAFHPVEAKGGIEMECSASFDDENVC